MNQDATSTHYPWPRYWLPIGSNYLTDEQGFPTLKSNDLNRSMMGKTLDDLATIPCLILLGEPGMGKSTVINDLDSSFENQVVSKYKLNRRSNESDLFNSIEKQPEFESWLNSDIQLYLYLDAFDEAFLNIKTIHNSIVDWIFTNKRKFKIEADKSSGKHSFFLRITCRSAVWSSETTRNLEEVFGQNNVQLCELAPLTQENVRMAAKYENINDDEFIEAISTADSASFASEPITLKFLIDSYKSGTLSRTNTDKVQLYFSGCLHLCEELNMAYKAHATLTASQRLKIASRLAAYLILTKRSAIWNSLGVTGATANDLLVDEIVGDSFSIDGSTEILTLQIANEVINTGLFTLLDENRFVFKHKMFAEYLAAWHINSIVIPIKLIQQFLTSSHDSFKAIPQIQEMITWLASINESVFNLFKKHEPFLLLRSSRSLNHQEKTDLINSLLRLSSKFEIMDNYESRKFYPNLKHNKLARQLRPTILNSSKNVVTRRVAITIAGACAEKELTQPLLKILNTKHEELYLRKEALDAIGSIDIADNLISLAPYGLSDQPEDSDDELKGSALTILYPSILTTTQMLTSLTKVKNHSLYGTYKGFLDAVGYIIPDIDLEPTLEVLSSNDRFLESNGHSDFENFVQKIVERCWSHNLNPKSLNLFSRLLYKMKLKSISFIIPLGSTKRKPIVSELLNLIDDPLDVYNILGSGANDSLLIQIDDWPWLVDMLKGENTLNRSKISRILWMLLDYNNSAHTIEFLELMFQYKEIKDSFQHSIDALEIDSEESKKIKQNYARRAELRNTEVFKENKPILSFSAAEKCKDLLKDFTTSNLDIFWQIIFLMRIDEAKGTFSTSHDFEFDITKLPLWDSLSDIHNSLVEMALMYVNGYTPKSNWIFTDKFNRRELAGYKALLLIHKKHPEFLKNVSESFWKEWHATILYCTFNSVNELAPDRKLILRLCFNANINNTRFYQTLQKYLTRRLENKKDLYDLYKIKEVANDYIAGKLLKIISSKKCSHINQEYILDFLFEQSPSLARRFSMKLFKHLTSDKLPLEKADLAVLASSKLLLHPDETSWPSFWSTLKRNKIAKSVFLKAAPSLGFGETRQIKLLTAKQKAEILIWLYQHFPPVEDPVHQSAYRPSDRDELRDYRSQMLRSLIEQGSVESVNALRTTSATLSGISDFRWWLVSAKEIMRRNTWVPPNPRQLRNGLNNSQKRFVRSDIELLSVIEESLERLQNKLIGNNPTSFFLWNYSAAEGRIEYKPKDENSLSDFIRMHLDYDLVGRSLIVNREIEIKRSTGKKDGAKTDLYIQAINPLSPHDIISLVIETKGCWHAELDSAMETQLKNKYLSKYKSHVGLYLVGWYYCKHYKAPNKHKNRASFKRKLELQSRQISQPGIVIKTLVLDCSL